MKMQYRATKFRPDTLVRIEQAVEIIGEYGGQKLTARQVYYQFVSRDLIENTPRSYQNLTAMLTDARYAGMIPWDAIEDRGREVDTPGEWEKIDEIIDAAMNQWRSPRWRDQKCYVELWVEKQALAGVLSPIARRWHVPLMVNKGYSSASAMHAAAQRMLEAAGVGELQIVCDNCGSFFDDRSGDTCNACETKTNAEFRYFETEDRGGECFDPERPIIVLYLGDHDPSGEDMVRDINDRLVEFGVPNLEVIKVGLTMAQIQPPNPAKITDSRAAGYIEKYGTSSWELDALPPRELNRIVEAAIRTACDVDAYEATIAAENVEREKARKQIAKARKTK